MLNSIQFLNENTGYCAGNNSIFLYTTNGGTNWFYRIIGIAPLAKVHFVNDTLGFPSI